MSEHRRTITKGEVMTVWVSKYAISTGIIAARVRACGNGLVKELKPDGTDGWGYYHKGDWHLTRAEAEQKAEKIRLRKIASVKKQLARLEALSFVDGMLDGSPLPAASAPKEEEQAQ